MKLVQKTLVGLLIGFAATSAMAGMSDTKKSPGTIVAVAAANPDFSTLVTAVKAAGLVDTLNSKGPFTVFAPTNEAFAKLPAGALDGGSARRWRRSGRDRDRPSWRLSGDPGRPPGP